MVYTTEVSIRDIKESAVRGSSGQDSMHAEWSVEFPLYSAVQDHEGGSQDNLEEEERTEYSDSSLLPKMRAP